VRAKTQFVGCVDGRFAVIEHRVGIIAPLRDYDLCIRVVERREDADGPPNSGP